uniref:LescPth2 n=1 Tax=Solanum tuberosum TaxID=4113 RepID=M1BF68_SOLTU
MGSKYSKQTTHIADASNSSYRVPFESFRVPFLDLEEATNNFDDKFFIAKGGFGSVYRGVLRDGTKVALKRPARVQLEMVSLANWAMESQKNGQLERIIDPNLVGKIRPDSLKIRSINVMPAKTLLKTWNNFEPLGSLHMIW